MKLQQLHLYTITYEITNFSEEGLKNNPIANSFQQQNLLSAAQDANCFR